MPGPKPPAVPLSEAERQELQSLVRARTTGQQLALRARIILLLAEGRNAPQVAQVLATTRRTVRLWRRHWLKIHWPKGYSPLRFLPPFSWPVPAFPLLF